MSCDVTCKRPRKNYGNFWLKILEETHKRGEKQQIRAQQQSLCKFDCQMPVTAINFVSSHNHKEMQISNALQLKEINFYFNLAGPLPGSSIRLQ